MKKTLLITGAMMAVFAVSGAHAGRTVVVEPGDQIVVRSAAQPRFAPVQLQQPVMHHTTLQPVVVQPTVNTTNAATGTCPDGCKLVSPPNGGSSICLCYTETGLVYWARPSS